MTTYTQPTPIPQQPANLPHLTVVPDTGNTLPQALGGVIAKAGERPSWIESRKARAASVAEHITGNQLYVGWSVRGYRNLGRRWLEARHDYWPQMIQSAEDDLTNAKADTAAETTARELLDWRRATYRQHKRWHWLKTGGWGAAATISAGTGIAFGGLWVELLMAVATYTAGAWNGRPGTPVASTAIEGGDALAPPPPAIDEDTLLQALKEIRVPAGTRIEDVPPWNPDGTVTVILNLPGGFTVTMLKQKAEALAGALGRDESWIDITKAGTANRAALWISDKDPFTAPRPSPLLTTNGGIDAFKDGVPVAWAKRGTTVCLPVNNSSFLIAGMTRSGKGVGAANLVAGSAMDVRINLRIVAGKTNGEWDAYAKAGVAATYFKPNNHRLLALLQALTADMKRRNDLLGEVGKSKVTTETINRLGGIELLIIDELAAYTRTGNPLRDEILKELTDLSAVAAGAGILVVLITQYPEVDVIPKALAMNCGTRWAMRVDDAIQSNAVLGGTASSGGRDASKFDPPLPGLGWLVNPFASVTDKARSFDLDEDERGEITQLMERAAALRDAAGRLVGQWDDPIERALLNSTGLSSAAGGPQRNGQPGRHVAQMTPEQKLQLGAVRGALEAMDQLGRDAAQLDEMAKIIGAVHPDELGKALRDAGAGGTVKITLPGREGQVRGYRRDDIKDALDLLLGT